jgi:hypothetical protein
MEAADLHFAERSFRSWLEAVDATLSYSPAQQDPDAPAENSHAVIDRSIML